MKSTDADYIVLLHEEGVMGFGRDIGDDQIEATYWVEGVMFTEVLSLDAYTILEYL